MSEKSKNNILQKIKAELFDLRNKIEQLESKELELLEEIEMLEQGDFPYVLSCEFGQIFLN